MITRKLLAALVGLSLAAGTLGTASAQTTAPMTTQAAGPSGTTTPPVSANADAPKTASVRKAHHARMSSHTHRKHVSLRGAKSKTAKAKIAKAKMAKAQMLKSKTASKTFKAKHLVSKRIGTKVAGRTSGQRVRVSHVAKHTTTKRV